MAINLLAIEIRNERRIRVLFTNTLAGGAFGIAPTLYVITSEDGRGVSPSVSAALVVPGTANGVELALGNDLVKGALYKLRADGVPAVDLSVTPVNSTQLFKISEPTTVPNEEANSDAWDLVLYGRDIVWTGSDFLETANGDLATETGIPVVRKAILKRCTSAGLPWDGSYGAKPDEYVDAVQGAMPSLRGVLLTQLAKDDRLKAVRVDLTTEDDQSFFVITPTLIGEDNPVTPINIEVPIGT